MPKNVYTELFEEHRSKSIEDLWPWQTEVLGQYADADGDAAVELPTGAGKTLIGLLAGEQHRKASSGRRVAYLAGNKQLAQQVERHAQELGFPVVRFEGKKGSWDHADVRKYNFGQAIGVMNYWNYFNAEPGVEPAGMLILDDVHLLEGPLRDMFTVSISSSDPLVDDVLSRIVECYPYYSLADDLLNEVDVNKPPEMLAFPDSANLAKEIRDLLSVALPGTSNQWAWQNIRDRLEICCWLVSRGGVSFTPYIPPAQTLEHFRAPSRRLYLSATIGTVDDLQRRLGAPPLELLSASAQPKQGERLVVIRDDTEVLEESELVEQLRPILEDQGKALWLCARKDTAANVHDALLFAELDGEVRILEGNNAHDEPFSEEDSGHLIAAGRYDGMDFPGDTCRLEVIPEVPIATSDLEEFVSAFLRDAPFAQARFGQRVAQALGRCNRTEDDRAVYLLTDPEFLGRFSQQRVVDALPGHAREDVFAAVVRSDEGFEAGLADAEDFLAGGSPKPVEHPDRGSATALPPTAAEEVEGSLALWTEGYQEAADHFDRVANALGGFREYRGFWFAMRALALERAAEFGDKAAGRLAKKALTAATAAGGRNVFFTRLGIAAARSEGEEAPTTMEGDDDLFSAWDRLMDRYGTVGPQFDRWTESLLGDLRSSDHDTVARGISRVGEDLLGLGSGAPKATSGEEDAYWELVGPRRLLTFEVKLAPKARTVVNDDVEQAEGAAKAGEVDRGYDAKGLLVTPHDEVEETAAARLERVRLLKVDVLVGQVEKILAALRGYRREWSSDAGDRSRARVAAVADLPPIDWFWRASAQADDWVEEELLEEAWNERSVSV